MLDAQWINLFSAQSIIFLSFILLVPERILAYIHSILLILVPTIHTNLPNCWVCHWGEHVITERYDVTY